MFNSRALSATPLRLNPSAMLAATDTDALCIWQVRPYVSCFGKLAVRRYTASASRWAFCHTKRSLKFGLVHAPLHIVRKGTLPLFLDFLEFLNSWIRYPVTVTLTSKLTASTSAGGCASKLSPKILDRVLARIPRWPNPNVLVGFDTADDAGVYKLTPEIRAGADGGFFQPGGRRSAYFWSHRRR